MGVKVRVYGDAVFDQDRLWPDARDVFVAWFPIKYLSLTAAYVDLGNIATHAHQKG